MPSIRRGWQKSSPTGRRSHRRTPFAGVQQLAPGHYAILDREGLRESRYWAPSFPERGLEPRQDIDENAQALREALVTATRLRFLRSDVPVAAYLSGGVDSSITAAVIARLHPGARCTPSRCGSRMPSSTRASYQARMSASLGTEHHEIVVSAADIAEVFPRRRRVTPRRRSCGRRRRRCSCSPRRCRESGFKVVVTGEGADEVLAGYDVFREARVREFLARDPASPVRRRALELLYPVDEPLPGQVPGLGRAASSAGTSTPRTRRSRTALAGSRPPL